MKLGFAPLWSAWMELSNDVHFAVDRILTQNHEKPWIIAFGRVRFLAKMWPILKVPFRISAKGSLHADRNGANPSFISHSNAWIRISSVDIQSRNYVWAKYYTKYLWPQKSWIIAFGWVRFLTKMWQKLIFILKTSFESYLYADHNGTIPSFTSKSHTRGGRPRLTFSNQVSLKSREIRYHGLRNAC